MADLTCSIGRSDIIKIDYNKELKNVGSQQIQLKINVTSEVLYKAEEPLRAIVRSNVSIKDEQNDMLHLNMIVLTPVTASSFIDNLPELVKKQYTPIITAVIAEKVKEISSFVGTPINLPATAIPVGNSDTSFGS